LKPVKVDQEIVVEGFETDVKGRNLFLAAEIRNGAGEVLAKGTGRFVVVGQKEKAATEVPGA
jgi:acyl-CoA thioesterase FadM